MYDDDIMIMMSITMMMESTTCYQMSLSLTEIPFIRFDEV